MKVRLPIRVAAHCVGQKERQRVVVGQLWQQQIECIITVQVSISEQGNVHNESLSQISTRQCSVCGSAPSMICPSAAQISA